MNECWSVRGDVKEDCTGYPGADEGGVDPT